MAKSSDNVWRVVLAGSGWPPIWCAAALGDSAAVRRELVARADPNAVGDQGSSPLHVAAEYGHLDVVELLLAAGADPNQADPHGNGPLWTAVHQACLAKRTDHNLAIVSRLLAGGAYPDRANKYGRTPRDSAALRDPDVLALFGRRDERT
jgi:uncharacterized protein